MSFDRPVRFGILGAGRLVPKLAAAFRLARGAELVALASRDLVRAQTLARDLGIPCAYGDYRALLDDADVDVVYVVLHNGLHCEWACQSLAAGKHVLCEKPLAVTAAEGAAMFAAARAANRWLMEGFMYRFHPQIAEAQRRIARGDLGRLVHIQSARIAPGREPGNPRYQRAAGGGALLDIGCYSVDFARLFMGGAPMRVTAVAQFDPVTDVDLTLWGTLEFTGNRGAQFVCSFVGEPTYSAEIVGTQGKLFIPHPWMPPVWPTEIFFTHGTQSETIRIAPPDGPQHMFAPFALEFEHFAACVRENRPPTVVTEADSLGNLRALEALAESARSGQPVSL